MTERKLKDSGIPWIGLIPEHWPVHFLRGIADNFRKGNGITKEDLDANGNISCIRYGDLYTKYNHHITEVICKTNKERITNPVYASFGDIYFTCSGEDIEAIGKSAAFLSNEPCLIGGDLIIMKHSQNPRFMGYMLDSEMCQKQKSYGKSKLKVVHISVKDLKNIAIPIPPMEEQERIAEWLDGKCGEIDELIEVEQQMIADLEAYRQAVITEAVTHGLNPNAPTKPTSIPWLPEIPQHWNIKKLKFSCSIKGRIGFRGYTNDDIVQEGKGAITLSPSNMKNGKMDYSKLTYLSWEKYFESPEIMIENGNLLMVKTGSTFGKMAYVELLPMVSTINPQIIVIKDFKDSPKFILYSMMSFEGKSNIALSVVGGTIPTIAQEKILNYELCMPPLSEQQEIAEYLDGKCAEIDELIKVKQEKIETLKQYRQSLIFEAVTGQTTID